MELEIGTKVYSYQMSKDNCGSYRMTCKIGEVKSAPNNSGTMIVFEDGRRLYDYARTHNYNDMINKCSHGRVLLLVDDPDRAKELFIKYEEDQILSLKSEILKRENMINVIESI